MTHDAADHLVRAIEAVTRPLPPRRRTGCVADVVDHHPDDDVIEHVLAAYRDAIGMPRLPATTCAALRVAIGDAQRALQSTDHSQLALCF